MAGAQIIRLPLKERLCTDCEYAALSTQGVFCMEFSEPIWDERGAAADCEMFDPIPIYKSRKDQK